MIGDPTKASGLPTNTTNSARGAGRRGQQNERGVGVAARLKRTSAHQSRGGQHQFQGRSPQWRRPLWRRLAAAAARAWGARRAAALAATRRARHLSSSGQRRRAGWWGGDLVTPPGLSRPRERAVAPSRGRVWPLNSERLSLPGLTPLNWTPCPRQREGRSISAAPLAGRHHWCGTELRLFTGAGSRRRGEGGGGDGGRANSFLFIFQLSLASSGDPGMGWTCPVSQIPPFSITRGRK